jgi:Methyltransferase domain
MIPIMNIYDVYRPFLTYFRRRRMRNFIRLMAVDDSASVVDVGGTPFVWNLADCHPSVTMINLRAPQSIDGNVRMVIASGMAIPFPDESFDICFSNSVIEHVGDARARAEFSREVRRVARRYWVQTPNRRFFIEPHFLCLFLHWLPFRVKRHLIRNFTVWGLVTRPTQKRVDEALLGITLLDEREMRELFPDAEMMKERWLGMVKSLIAVKRL